MTWIRIDLKHRLKNDGKGGPDEPDSALARRVYGENGKLYPRLTIAIYEYPDGLSFDISQCLDRRNPWWTDCRLPKELASELIEVLEEARRK